MKKVFYKIKDSARILIESSDGSVTWFYHCGKTKKDLYQGVSGKCIVEGNTLIMYSTDNCGDSWFESQEEFNKERETLPLWYKTEFVEDVDD